LKTPQNQIRFAVNVFQLNPQHTPVQTGISAIPEYRSWVQLGSGVGGGRPIGLGHFGLRAEVSPAVWQACSADHPLERMYTRYVPDATPSR